MGFIKFVCPNCGANVELSDDREFGFCMYCGTKLIQDKVVIEHRGNVSVSGIASVQSLLKRTILFIEEKDYERALTYCEKVLDIDPHNGEAYTYRLLAQTHCSSLNELSKTVKPLIHFDSYKNAFRFSSKTTAEKLVSANECTIQNYNEEKEEFENKLAGINAQLSERKKQESRASHLVSLSTAVSIVLATFFFITLILFSKRWPTLICFILLLISIAFSSKKKKESKELKDAVDRIAENAEIALNEYEEWETWISTYEK